jgi:Transcriptional regulator
MTSETVSRRRQQTLDRLVAAAIDVFAERGVEAASVEEICERAGFTRGAFYSNFDSKEELCLAIVRQQSALMLASTRQALAAIPSAAVDDGSLDEIVAKVLALVDAEIGADHTWVVVRDELRLYAYRNRSFWPALQAATDEVAELFRQAIQEAFDRQQAHLLIPMDQFVVTVDAYRERLRLEEILGTARANASNWRLGMEKLIRALVVLPGRAVEGGTD